MEPHDANAGQAFRIFSNFLSTFYLSVTNLTKEQAYIPTIHNHGACRHLYMTTSVWDWRHLTSTKFDCHRQINLFWTNTAATGYSRKQVSRLKIVS